MNTSSQTTNEYDFIVVGSGSAGAVIAKRLAEDADSHVLLIESGTEDSKLHIRCPAAVGEIHRHEMFDWGYETVPQPQLNNRRLRQPRGKIIGGSSSINGMIFTRGHALDFQRWEQEGAAGWGYADVLPYFKKLENHQGRDSDYRGTRGPVRTLKPQCVNPLYGAFINAGVQAGYPTTDDPNGFQQEGFGPYDSNIQDGIRCSTGYAYLKERPENLSVMANASVAKLIIENDRARGVSIVSGGKRTPVHARQEVIVCAGAVGSPTLLMQSGIGAADELKQLNIEPILDLPGVGQNLQDHLEFHFDIECTQPITLYNEWKIHNKAIEGIRWLWNKRGSAAKNHLEVGAFIRSRAGIEHPDIQYHFIPMSLSKPHKIEVHEHGYRTHVGPLRTQSRGTIKLRSNDPTDMPLIDPNHMSCESDWEEMRACFHLTREIFAQEAFAPFRGSEIWPGNAVQTTAEFDDYLRERAVSAHHLCGTCKMGEDEMAVVDSHCRVLGINGLRVVDTSVMPSMTSGNLHAPTMMIAEKISDHIRAREPLPPEDLPFYHCENWQVSQR